MDLRRTYARIYKVWGGVIFTYPASCFKNRGSLLFLLKYLYFLSMSCGLLRYKNKKLYLLKLYKLVHYTYKKCDYMMILSVNINSQLNKLGTIEICNI